MLPTNFIWTGEIKDVDLTSYPKIKFISGHLLCYNSNQEKFKRQEFQNIFQLGFVRDIPIISSGN